MSCVDQGMCKKWESTHDSHRMKIRFTTRAYPDEFLLVMSSMNATLLSCAFEALPAVANERGMEYAAFLDVSHIRRTMVGPFIPLISSCPGHFEGQKLKNNAT